MTEAGRAGIPTVFISATQEDLAEHRTAARDAAIDASFFPITLEYFPASGQRPPLAECLAKVVREEKPVALDDDSEPEPDLAVVSGTHRDYSAAHPARPVLVVEVSESSLAWDRGEKGSLYARAGIGDYWIVNLIDRVLEVYRSPVLDASALHGWRYGSVETFAPPSTVSPESLPGAHIPVAGLLP